jgi:hypothetical protein
MTTAPVSKEIAAIVSVFSSDNDEVGLTYSLACWQ